MIVTKNITEINKYFENFDAFTTRGFVPTMGYLHKGHLSLVQRAKLENDIVAVSIYINPTQFSPDEDLNAYPRDLERDLELLDKEGVDIVFTPSDQELYPQGFQTIIKVNNLTAPLEGSSRPTHFQGVTTIVGKLFNIIQPTTAYFGQKDGQQSLVVKRMVQDLNFNVQIVVCPTVREEDGLAMSSRNKYLSVEERQQAPILYRALKAAQGAYLKGEISGDKLRRLMSSMINQATLARIDYVSAADPDSLNELDKVERGVMFSTAVFFGKTRLIDNILIS